MANQSLKSLPPFYSRQEQQGQPLLISGSCSVESEEQYINTALALAKYGRVHWLRGGIWKPRTRPDAFEGVGAEGLPWMIAAREASGLPVMTEVANADHVEACLKHGLDALWIGARTTVNPFTVQEIADALKGVDIPVFVKNPVNPDLSLWLGGLERIQRAGITKLAAIHRGFSHVGDSIYRNKPMWEIPIALRTAFPNITLICDPSHICGRRDLLQRVAQKAMDLGFDGWMIESHLDPDKALSDAAQQVTPEQLITLLDTIEIRHEHSDNLTFTHSLQSIRSRIDKVDEEIIHLIGKRMRIAEELGNFKRDESVTIFQIDRWKEILESRTMLAEQVGLSKEFITKYLEQLHKESIRRQTKVMNRADDSSTSL
jgi:chorismate mutase